MGDTAVSTAYCRSTRHGGSGNGWHNWVTQSFVAAAGSACLTSISSASQVIKPMVNTQIHLAGVKQVGDEDAKVALRGRKTEERVQLPVGNVALMTGKKSTAASSLQV